MSDEGRPRSPRSWYLWAEETTDSYRRARSFEIGAPRGDGTLSSRRETAISIVILFERAAGKHSELLSRYYVEGGPWDSFNPQQRTIILATSRAFSKALRKVGYLPA